MSEDEFSKEKSAFTSFGGDFMALKEASDDQMRDLVGADSAEQVHVVQHQFPKSIFLPLQYPLFRFWKKLAAR